MSSWGDSYELKVKTFDKTEQEIKDLGYKVPEITYKYSYEEYIPQTKPNASPKTLLCSQDTVSLATLCHVAVCLCPSLRRASFTSLFLRL